MGREGKRREGREELFAEGYVFAIVVCPTESVDNFLGMPIRFLYAILRTIFRTAELI